MTDHEPLVLQPLEFSTPVGDLGAGAIVESEDGAVTIVEVVRRSGDQYVLAFTGTWKAKKNHVKVPPAHDLGDATIKHLHSRPVRAFTLPPGRVEVTTRRWVPALRVLAGLSALGAIVPVTMNVSHEALRAFLLVVLMVVVVGSVLWTPKFQGVHGFESHGVTYGLRELVNSRPGGAAATKLVEGVKAEYGELLSDIVTRIEWPALFDPAVPQTRELTAALIRWDTTGPDLSPAEAGALAAEVRVTFDRAVAHARAVGLGHVPEQHRDDARRALGAARLAREGSTAAERAAALQQAQRILTDLALYYLPDPEEAQLMIEGRQVLALPGRLLPPTEQQ